MKKIIFILILIFFTVGCGRGASTSKISDVDIFVGTEGLTAEFSKTAPPPKVFESSDFPILLRIRNKGAYSIDQDGPKGILSISREKDYVPVISFEKESRVESSGK
ncbi:hypothetical protein HYX02_08250, partial [Candidatus Woesearchaeota archaeon]|nr:hypothetical protein [Candidatus Woesearchaeota archaeon]